jgi:hypothetical protein
MEEYENDTGPGMLAIALVWAFGVAVGAASMVLCLF